MNPELHLENIRSVLIRLEETIIFGLIERAQFKQNPIVYRRAAIDGLDEALVDYLLHETERIHARMRRYTSPDEHPFFQDLPAPVLPALRYDDNPLQPNRLNLNSRIRAEYETFVIPRVCDAGDDGQYGSSAVSDVSNLQALSKRIHYGKFVAESKYRRRPAEFEELAHAADRDGLLAAVTDLEVERQVVERVGRKAETYGLSLVEQGASPKIDPGAVVQLYAEWIIPLNKHVQVEYLLERVPRGG